LQAALETLEANEGPNRKLNDALRGKIILRELDEPATIRSACDAGVLTAAEAERLLAQDRQIMELIQVDDFAPEELTPNRSAS